MSGTNSVQQLAGFRCLVVDDEKIVLDLMSDILKDAGCAVEAFPSPVAALNAAKKRKFDALVLDVYMPELPGMLLHAKLKLFDRELAGRTVFVSGYFTRDELRRDLQESAVLLGKPFKAAELVDAVASVLPEKSRSTPT